MTNVASSKWYWINHRKLKKNSFFHHQKLVSYNIWGFSGGFFFWKYTIILHYTRFQVLLSLSTEYFSPFHHCTCFLLVSFIIFSFWWYLPPVFRLHSQTALLLIKPPNKKTHRNLECQQGFHLVLWRNFPNI
jgi:hypothetical protein